MSDLIRRRDALDALNIVGAWSTKEQRRALSQADYKLHHVPAVDAAPVVHARWVYTEDYAHSRIGWHCTKCRKHIASDAVAFAKYCPSCGAKMDGRAEDDCV